MYVYLHPFHHCVVCCIELKDTHYNSLLELHIHRILYCFPFINLLSFLISTSHLRTVYNIFLSYFSFPSFPTLSPPYFFLKKEKYNCAAHIFLGKWLSTRAQLSVDFIILKYNVKQRSLALNNSELKKVNPKIIINRMHLKNSWR